MEVEEPIMMIYFQWMAELKNTNAQAAIFCMFYSILLFQINTNKSILSWSILYYLISMKKVHKNFKLKIIQG